jgi:hypothetical protein
MYPRQPNFGQSSNYSPSSAGSMARSASKREQVAKLLITKFRNKFSVNLNAEAELDAQIVESVHSMVRGDDQLHEKQLI